MGSRVVIALSTIFCGGNYGSFFHNDRPDWYIPSGSGGFCQVKGLLHPTAMGQVFWIVDGRRGKHSTGL
jgi:hypothetical protein